MGRNTNHFQMSLVRMTVVFFLIINSALAESYRWENLEGATITAEFRGFSESGVHLRTENGKDYTFPLEKLSPQSQKQALALQAKNPGLGRGLNVPVPYLYRLSDLQRFNRIRDLGGTVESERAVLNGLRWLAAAQNQDGSFGVKYHVASTGLSLLAMLGHGETPGSELYGDAIAKGALYLLTMSKNNDGLMFNGYYGNHLAYEHGIATMALAELYALTKGGEQIPKLDIALKKAVTIITKGQTELGGWAYGYKINGRDDLSLSGWQYQALHSAFIAMEEPKALAQAMEKAQNYLTKIQDDEGAFKYSPGDHRGKRSLTPAALFCMQLGRKADSTHYLRGRAYLEKGGLLDSSQNFYTPYFNLCVAFNESGEFWETQRERIVQELIQSQNKDGSWTEPDVGTGPGSEETQFTNTTWAILMLENYYRYVLPMQ